MQGENLCLSLKSNFLSLACFQFSDTEEAALLTFATSLRWDPIALESSSETNWEYRQGVEEFCKRVYVTGNDLVISGFAFASIFYIFISYLHGTTTTWTEAALTEKIKQTNKKNLKHIVYVNFIDSSQNIVFICGLWAASVRLTKTNGDS